MEMVLPEGLSTFNSCYTWLKVSYCSADDYGAYLLWITTIVMKDVYENKENKDLNFSVLTKVTSPFRQL